ncbi:hypothetical protein PMAYCL1PPCAC_00911, partial [Pristionchus mayeri]
SMRAPPVLILLAVFTVSHARITFPYSDVLQVNDLVNQVANFYCDKGCKVYVGRTDDALYISQNGQFIANFKDIIGNNTFEPDGIELPAGQNYKLQSQSAINADFVFYAVSRDAPNYGAPVFAPQQKQGIDYARPERYFTLLSRFDALEFYGITGSFPPGYPKIYSTGFDAAPDARCSPVYEARSQSNAEQSRPMISSPIMTVDFGYTGKHEINAKQSDGKNPMKFPVASTVYMSPGYVGCSFIGGNKYFTNTNSVQDNFTLTANSLDINAVYNLLLCNEAVQFRVNDHVLDFSGTNSSYWGFSSGSFDVSLSWTRQSVTSSWAMQLDFAMDLGGSSPRPPETTTSGAGSYPIIFVSAVTLALSMV